MKLRFRDIDKKWKEYALAGCVCILFFVCITNLGRIWSVLAGFFRILKPVFLGFVIAYIINPLAVFFQDKLFKKIKKERIRWTVSVMLTLVIGIFAMALLMASLIPQIIDNIVSLAKNYQSYIAGLKSFIENLDGPIADLPIIDDILEMLSSDGGLIAQIGKVITNNAAAIIEKTTSIGAAAVSWFIGGIFAVYFLMAKHSIKKTFARLFTLLLSSLEYQRVNILVEKFNTIFSKYIVCELLDSLIVAGVNYVFMGICGMPDSLFISFIIGITNLAPTFGPIIGAVLAVFILLLVDPAAILPFLIFTVVIQSLDAYVIKPKLFGDALNVPGVLILVAIIIFGKLMGVPGMLIAIPAAGIIVYIYTELFIPWLELKKDLKAYKKEQSQEISLHK